MRWALTMCPTLFQMLEIQQWTGQIQSLLSCSRCRYFSVLVTLRPTHQVHYRPFSVPLRLTSGLHHQSSSPPGFLIKLQRTYWRGCLVSRVPTGRHQKSKLRVEGRVRVFAPQLPPCLFYLSCVAQPKATVPTEGPLFQVSSSSQNPAALSSACPLRPRAEDGFPLLLVPVCFTVPLWFPWPCPDLCQ